MQVYLYLDNHDLEEIAKPIAEKFQAWLKESGFNADFINNKIEDSISDLDPEFDTWHLGLQFFVTRKQKLKSPIQIANEIAKEFEQNFVLGEVLDDGELSPICYFGCDEGDGDMFEIANYLGL